MQNRAGRQRYVNSKEHLKLCRYHTGGFSPLHCNLQMHHVAPHNHSQHQHTTVSPGRCTTAFTLQNRPEHDFNPSATYCSIWVTSAGRDRLSLCLIWCGMQRPWIWDRPGEHPQAISLCCAIQKEVFLPRSRAASQNHVRHEEHSTARKKRKSKEREREAEGRLGRKAPGIERDV